MPDFESFINFDQSELDIIKNLSPFNYPVFHKWRINNDIPHLEVLFKAYHYLNKCYKVLCHDPKCDGERLFNVQIKLAHICLVGGDEIRSLSIYQESLNRNERLFSQSFGAYFGLGVTYFQLKQFTLASEAFLKHLFLFEDELASVNAHCYLGLIYQLQFNFNRAVKHLSIAQSFSKEGYVLSKEEIRFSIAHCYECAGDSDKARSEYKNILDELSNNIPSTVQAAIYRQLGWLNYKSGNIKEASELLEKSQTINPNCGRTAYFLGRLNSEAKDKAHFAFTQYRQSFDKGESEADTWCSIGVLYRQQEQTIDALQAFTSSLRIDPKHSITWYNLGDLYEKHLNFHDALECYKTAVGFDFIEKEKVKKRIAVLEKELQFVSPEQLAQNSAQVVKPPPLKEAMQLALPTEISNSIRKAIDKRIFSHFEGGVLWTSPELLIYTMKRSGHNIQTNCDIHVNENLKQILSYNKDLLESSELQALRLIEETFPKYRQNNIYDYGFSEIKCSELRNAFEEVKTEYIDNVHDPKLKDEGNSKEDANLKFGPMDYMIRKDQDNNVSSSQDEFPSYFSLLTEASIPLSTTSNEILKIVGVRATNLSEFTPIYKENEMIKLFDTPNEDLTSSQLTPATPLLQVETTREAHSIELQNFCYNASPITCIRGLTSTLKIDLGLFSTKTLLETVPNHDVEVRTQYLFPPDVNTNHAGEKSWEYYSKKSFTKVTQYAKYQAESFKRSMKEETEKLKNIPAGRYNTQNNLDGEHSAPPTKRKKNSLAKEPQQEVKPSNIPMKMLKFGTNVDLSDPKIFQSQLKEIAKLPAFCRLEASCNALTHIDHCIFGMNTVQLYMKVPGARTPAHQENNNFASVNINTGPGECVWYGVAYEYFPRIERMCRKRGIDFLKGSWWPAVEDLLEAKVPVYKFTQKAGDLVFVNSGCIHWVESKAWCNNIAWNVGPMTSFQMKTAFFSHEWNRLNGFKSLVPLQHMCWQFAKNVRFTNSKLYKMIRNVLVKSLAYQKMLLDYLGTQNKMPKSQPRDKNEVTHYCTLCEIEVFNILFVKENQGGVYNVFCANCSRKSNQQFDEFIVLQQISLESLCETFDLFQLHPTKHPLISDFDDLIDKGKTDVNGEFFVQGAHKEITPIDPKINIYHRCNDWFPIPFCKKKFTIKIPNQYISQGDTPKSIYMAGSLELSGEFPGQSRDCIH
uniref:JmjC domain-containing protein n=1 Tax=Parastrongyloides trichosuri TaxID=131310 RepID=A0A0N4ZK20_PARTI